MDSEGCCTTRALRTDRMRPTAKDYNRIIQRPELCQSKRGKTCHLSFFRNTIKTATMQHHQQCAFWNKLIRPHGIRNHGLPRHCGNPVFHCVPPAQSAATDFFRPVPPAPGRGAPYDRQNVSGWPQRSGSPRPACTFPPTVWLRKSPHCRTVAATATGSPPGKASCA